MCDNWNIESLLRKHKRETEYIHAKERLKREEKVKLGGSMQNFFFLCTYHDNITRHHSQKKRGKKRTQGCVCVAGKGEKANPINMGWWKRQRGIGESQREGARASGKKWPLCLVLSCLVLSYLVCLSVPQPHSYTKNI
jgi:hypothetical protein